MMTKTAMHTIQIWMFNGCMSAAVTGPLDILTAANANWAMRHPQAELPLFGWRLLSLDGQPVRTAPGLMLAADGPIDAQDAAEVVILPGIYVDRGQSGLAIDLAKLAPMVPLLQRMHTQGSLLAANCSATFLLAETGLLDGGQGTSAWWLERMFKARYPQVDIRVDAVLTEHEGVICSGAATTYLDLALHLVERFAGQDTATNCARLLLIDANRQSQTPYTSMTQQDGQAHGDALVLRAQKWMHQHQGHSYTLRELAGQLSVSERTLIRRFHKALHRTPTDYAQSLRIDTSKRLLATSTLSLNAVCENVGYQDLSAFRRLFKRQTGLTPTQYRERFRQADRRLSAV